MTSPRVACAESTEDNVATPEEYLPSTRARACVCVRVSARACVWVGGASERYANKLRSSRREPRQRARFAAAARRDLRAESAAGGDTATAKSSRAKQPETNANARDRPFPTRERNERVLQREVGGGSAVEPARAARPDAVVSQRVVRCLEHALRAREPERVAHGKVERADGLVARGGDRSRALARERRSEGLFLRCRRLRALAVDVDLAARQAPECWRCKAAQKGGHAGRQVPHLWGSAECGRGG
jgi:hypothetical protein